MEHLNGSLHQWHIVHHGRGETKQDGHQGIIRHQRAELHGELLQQTHAFQAPHGEENAQEEQGVRNLHPCKGTLQGVFLIFRTVEKRSDQSQEPQDQHHAAPGRALRQGCEDRHGDHSEETTPEDDGLTIGHFTILCTSRIALEGLVIHLNVFISQSSHQAQNAWNEEVGQQWDCGDLSADVQHGGGDVADRGPSSTGVGGDHHQAAQLHTEVLVLHELLEK
mmetsp:Transcript_60762/g.96218  ORF Transcript_60762/g.96218 Transcript_60762/m.96218 type:complete len:222 (+) Transcript_60762:396-1061(+)